MEEIAPETLNEIKSLYEKLVNSNAKAKSIVHKIEDGNGSYEDALEYAIELGTCLENTFKSSVKDEILSNGVMDKGIAQSLLEPLIQANYDYVSKQCINVQSILNNKANIRLKAIKPTYNKDRTDGLISYISDIEYAKREKSFLQALSTNSKSIVDDSVKQNADFQYESGLNPKIIRRSDGKCCKWCSSLVGVYDYEKVKVKGNIVFRRHANCNCSVSYDPGDGKIQNVWSKEWSKKNEVESNFKKITYPQHLGKDVTKEYYGKATPRVGMINIDKDYDIKEHKDEIAMAKWIHFNFGGDITLLTESKIEGKLNPDYLWRGKLWDLKTTSTAKSANSALRHGLKQIAENPGGIILNYLNEVSMSELQMIIDKRMKWYKGETVDIFIVMNNKLKKVIRI